MRTYYWILDGREPVGVNDCREWAQWFGHSDRNVKKTVLHADGCDPTGVSTVFLGIDHSFSEDGPPLLFETLIFGGPLDGEIWRSSTWDLALADHDAAIKELIAIHGALLGDGTTRTVTGLAEHTDDEQQQED